MRMKSKRMIGWILAMFFTLTSFYLGMMIPYNYEAYEVNQAEIDSRVIPVENIDSIVDTISNILWNKMPIVPIAVALVTLATVSAITLYFRVYRAEE